VKKFEYLEWTREGNIATLWLNRPPVNAVDRAFYREIIEFFESLKEILPDVSVLVLAGRGRHFCAGNDLREFQDMTSENGPGRMLDVRRAFWSIRDSPMPVIAAIQGVAVGTGVALAGSCDFVVAAEGARLGLPEINVGVMGGAKHLSRLVPQSVVRLLHYTGDVVAVEDLERYGGIYKIVPEDRLLDEAYELARKIARHSPLVLAFAKHSLNAIESMDLKRGYEYEQGLTSELSDFGDSKEAVNSFVEHRAPDYDSTVWTADEFLRRRNVVMDEPAPSEDEQVER
jgi:enoyl-CoA hydratase